MPCRTVSRSCIIDLKSVPWGDGIEDIDADACKSCASYMRGRINVGQIGAVPEFSRARRVQVDVASTMLLEKARSSAVSAALKVCEVVPCFCASARCCAPICICTLRHAINAAANTKLPPTTEATTVLSALAISSEVEPMSAAPNPVSRVTSIQNPMPTTKYECSALRFSGRHISRKMGHEFRNDNRR